MDTLKRDIDIFYRIWDKVEKPKAIIQIFHGMVEHISRYHDFAKYLNDHSYIVVGMDMRGHGQTGLKQGRLGHFADQKGWEKILEDQKFLYDRLKKQYDLPIYLFGHSMGSFLARQYINTFPKDFQKVVICGTGSASDISYMGARFILRFLDKNANSKFIHNLAFGGYNKQVKNPKTDYDWLSTDHSQVKKYIDDPLCGGQVSNQFYVDFMSGMKEISKLEKSTKYTDSIFFISGRQDPVGNKGNYVIEVFDKYNKSRQKSFHIYQDMRHEILNEVNNDEVYQDILEFFEK